MMILKTGAIYSGKHVKPSASRSWVQGRLDFFKILYPLFRGGEPITWQKAFHRSQYFERIIDEICDTFEAFHSPSTTCHSRRLS
jgi:hypothetical protein